MATAITLGHGGTPANINLNDQSNYFVDAEGFNPGPYLSGVGRTTWDEAPNYAGGVGQVNVQRKGLVAISIPMWVVGSSVSNLNTLLGNLWTLVNTCVDGDPGTLQIASETSMSIVTSALPEEVQRDTVYELQFRAYFTLVLTRKP